MSALDKLIAFYDKIPQGCSLLGTEAAAELESLRKIEAAAKEVFDNCVLYDDKCHICTNTYSYEFSKEHAPDCKLKKLEEALGE